MQDTTSTKYVVEIDLGNAEMATGHHVAEALREVAQYVADTAGDEPVAEYAGSYRVRDVNGNKVGRATIQ